MSRLRPINTCYRDVGALAGIPAVRICPCVLDTVVSCLRIALDHFGQ